MSFLSFLSDILDRFFPPAPESKPTLSIGEIAAANDNFDILEAALSAAGLADTFTAPGDFTVFAPTDAAFVELASNTLGLDVAGKTETEIATLLVETLGVETLTDVLTYHVRAGSAEVSDLQAEGTVTTLLGATFDVNGTTLVDADPDVENPDFIAGLTDIQATNGVIQAIDRVLLPIDVAEAMVRPTIADVAGSNDSFEVLNAALAATGLDAVVDDRDASFTVFAPTDDAFRKLAADLNLDVTHLDDADIAGALVAALGAELVTDVLLYHVKAGGASVAELQDSGLIETALDGARLGIDGTELIDADPEIANANFIEGLTDISTANGEIQAIDRVLIPLDLGEPTGGIIKGTHKKDILIGSGGDDIIFGRKGNDIILGGDGDDYLVGNRGRDTLVDDDGDDRFVGGFGADTFDFTNLSGDNIVRDFFWRDELLLSRDDFATEQHVLDAATVTKRGLKIESGEDSVLLQYVHKIDADDFVLV
ncbi:fasciclin domain-containing protein [Sedimentitalea todarodis]|uniref:Fasciclin domain-containing protein n=1 Tax=Sedimentitalea todarodis TaxID=1631240 RepID=A0ABU3VDC6_9RHOB|nr:fasciclin domain-containing protein [Sedimentitalea todarodis]MDU9004166.1 fasciclin domain-containing protein [Sedimentitalea todarodis]